MKITTVLLLAFVNFSGYCNSQTIKIGTQTWATKNLNVAKFRNGDVISQAKTDEEWEAAGDNKQPAWCYYENNTANGTKYGKLYNWYAVVDYRGLAPTGQHIPTDEEWTVLSTFLGGEDVAGKKMKSSSGWITKSGTNGTNSSGFSGLPGGCRFSDGDFGSVGKVGSWWNASEYDGKTARYRGLNNNGYGLSRSYTLKDWGFSVRCVKD